MISVIAEAPTVASDFASPGLAGDEPGDSRSAVACHLGPDL